MVRQRVFNGKRFCARPMRKMKNDKSIKKLIMAVYGVCPDGSISCGGADSSQVAACLPVDSDFSFLTAAEKIELKKRECPITSI